MTTVQNTVPTPQNAVNASQSSGAGSPAVTGTPSPNSQSQAPRSYAHATKSSVSGPVANGSSAPLVVGASGSATENGKRDPVSAPQSNNMAAPAIVNSSAANGGSGPTEHTRKPSVTISAAGSVGSMPNGAPQTPSGARHNLTFGSMNATGSPAIANSTPYQAQQSSQPPPPNSQQNSTLAAPPQDPRVTIPAESPTPIPQPTTTGVRPPSISSSNGLNFGSLGGGPGPETSQNPHMSGTPQPGMMPGQPNAHFRRASSQSHGDYTPGIPMGPSGRGGGYSGRGNRGNYQGYAGMPNSPRFPSTQLYGQRPAPGGVPPHFQNQMAGHPGSPHNVPPRSPAPAQVGSNPPTPHSQPLQMQGQGMFPSYGGYANQLSGPPGQYGMQPGFDPNYAYYQHPYQMHPNYMPGQPSSPRNAQSYRPQQASNHQQPPYIQSQYGPAPGQNMSRSSSQMSVNDRPASALSSQHAPPPHSTTPQNNHASHNHTQSVGAAANSNFKIPTRTNKSIVIKNAEGEIVNFDTKKSSPAPASTPSPAPRQSPAPSNPTPPPRASSSSSHRHSRSDSQSGKSTAEIRAEFQEKVKREQEKEPGIKEEETPVVVRSDDTTKSQEPAIVKSEPRVAATSETAKPIIDNAAVDVPAPREGSKADELKTAKQDEPVESAPAKIDAEPEKPVTQATEETVEARKKREDDEEMERMIAEMEAKEREEEERERAYKEKKDRAKAEQAAKEKAEKENEDERLKQAERDAEALEEAREAEKAKSEEKIGDQKVEDDKMFAALKKTTPMDAEAEAQAPSPSTAPSTPAEDGKEGLTPRSARPSGSKQKPAALKLETAKMVEPAQPTPGMRSLRSARILNLQAESINYPEGISSPNPALNQSGRRGGKVYDKDFLMQFQEAFREKPSIDWDQKLKETLGDPSDSSVPKSARTPGPRQASHGHRPAGPAPMMQPMGSFAGPPGRTLPPGTSSEQRFAASSSGRPTMTTGALASRFGSQQPFPMGQGMPGGRAPSMGNMAMHPQASHRGTSKQGSKGARQPSAKEQAEANKKMPLTAGGELKPIEVTSAGWKPTSVGRPGAASGATIDGYLAPDMVQRKVKSNLNKLTPERFERISDDILKIAAQSQRETDGRTLRQVIALLFEKACDEAHWASMYARFANRMLHEMSSEVKDEGITDRSGQPVTGGNLFRKYLLNRCQEEFERGWEVNLPLNAEGQQGEAVMLSDEYYKAAAAKRKGLGLVQFIGELYKLGMLSAKIMHTCVKKLLDFQGDPDESAIESLTKLLRTVGLRLEEDVNGNQIMNAYFQRVDQIMSLKDLPSRMYFMLLDVRDLRQSGWSSKDDAKGPKTITEIREEAALVQQNKELERMKQNQRGGLGGRMPPGRGDARNFSGGPMPPPDYNRATIGTDDLRKLSARKAERQASSVPGKSLGPSSMMTSRSNSGRGLGPSASLMSRTGSSAGSSPGGSGLHSRSASMAKLDKKDDEPKTNVNAFSALASMENEGDHQTPSSSPPMTKSQPAAAASSSSKPEDKPSS